MHYTNFIRRGDHYINPLFVSKLTVKQELFGGEKWVAEATLGGGSMSFASTRDVVSWEFGTKDEAHEFVQKFVGEWRV